jgi:hypothetical protein
MNDQELIDRIRKIALTKGHTANCLPKLGTIQAVANIVIGARAIDAMANFGYAANPWDASFAVGQIMALFDDAPALISASMLIKCVESMTTTPLQFNNWITMCMKLDSAMLPKIMHNYSEVVKKVHGNVGPELANINTVINIYELVHVLNAFEGIGPNEQPDPIYNGVIRRHSQDRMGLRPSHPVMENIHLELLNELRDRNGGVKHAA